jgi:hypothetical protein
VDDVPASMRAELQRWNNGDGIDLESWISCEGSFRLAVGYSTTFWPRFESRGQYILRAGATEESIRSFETQPNSSPASVEAVLNHLHLKDIQQAFCEDVSSDKLIFLGNVLKEIYEAKLAWQFPDSACEVDLFFPDDRDDLWGYQITFWQKKWQAVANEREIGKADPTKTPPRFREGV